MDVSQNIQQENRCGTLFGYSIHWQVQVGERWLADRLPRPPSSSRGPHLSPPRTSLAPPTPPPLLLTSPPSLLPHGIGPSSSLVHSSSGVAHARSPSHAVPVVLPQ
ncbi:pectinesterase inhibitor 10-like [Esox lucius]|uniref:pectinesterase inhibitor 10-like n=1 Tax=Esox lucius TaxID=8010 RepID=UPI001476F3B5|nr:pectinesterase inhibitor 10-like [Esox lucius]